MAFEILLSCQFGIKKGLSSSDGFNLKLEFGGHKIEDGFLESIQSPDLANFEVYFGSKR